jgi:hypothetical protein
METSTIPCQNTKLNSKPTLENIMLTLWNSQAPKLGQDQEQGVMIKECTL